jgi:hypothetical protein
MIRYTVTELVAPVGGEERLMFCEPLPIDVTVYSTSAWTYYEW